MNDFQQSFDMTHLLYKYKNYSFKILRKELPGQQGKRFTLWLRNITKMRFALEKCKIDTFQTDFCDMSFLLHLLLALFRGSHWLYSKF